MKTLIVTILLIYSAHSFANAKVVGNGGNGIICRNSSGAITSTELLDYYELRLNGGHLTLNENLGSYQDILKDLFDRWTEFAPVRMAQYKKWLNEFPQEAGIYNGVIIPDIPDTGSIVIPVGCELKPIAFQRPDEEVLPGVKRYTINRDIWDIMPELQKSGLVLHELIYREGIKAGHKTSFPTRYFNGYLSSATPNGVEYASIVSQVPLLWTEFYGKVIVQVGVMKGNFACPTCGNFQRKSEISLDGKNLNIIITSALGDLETPTYKIRFRKHGSGIWSVKFRFSTSIFLLTSAADVPGGCNTAGGDITNVSEVVLENQFGFGFSHPVNCKYLLSYDRSLSRILNGDLGLKPASSWYNNSGELIQGISRIASDSLSNVDGIWYWVSKENRYIRQ